MTGRARPGQLPQGLQIKRLPFNADRPSTTVRENASRQRRRRREMAGGRNRRPPAQRFLHAPSSGCHPNAPLSLSLSRSSQTLILLVFCPSPGFILSLFEYFAQDSNNLRDALKYSAQMLSELRTSKLSPHKYYELCEFVDPLRAGSRFRILDLLIFLSDLFVGFVGLGGRYAGVRRIEEAGDVLQGGDNPYLLCTVGSVYIKSKEAPAKDVLKDLVEMCRGIQHPLRGLFLRSYLSQISRDKLPDIGSEYEGSIGKCKIK
ncbi:hypothetical protein ACLOJK_034183 [Asimina triloba]